MKNDSGRTRSGGVPQQEHGDLAPTRRRILSMAFGTVTTLALSACGRGDPDKVRETPGGARIWPPFRYRLTVEVETPEGLRTGSSVIEVRVRRIGRFAIPSPGALSSSIRGEAVAIDLPVGKTLFAILRSDDNVDWAHGAPFLVIGQQTIEQRVASPDPFATDMEMVLALEGVHALPRWYAASGRRPGDKVSGYPMLVTFTDIADPRTVKRVAPDDLAATFGKGVKLKRITVERTQDAVTTGIQARFPWWSKYRNRHFDGSSTILEDLTTSEISARMSSGTFSTEFNK